MTNIHGQNFGNCILESMHLSTYIATCSNIKFCWVISLWQRHLRFPQSFISIAMRVTCACKTKISIQGQKKSNSLFKCFPTQMGIFFFYDLWQRWGQRRWIKFFLFLWESSGSRVGKDEGSVLEWHRTPIMETSTVYVLQDSKLLQGFFLWQANQLTYSALNKTKMLLRISKPI